MLCAFPMLLAGAVLTAESEAPPSRWSLGPDGALTWRVDSDPRLPHRDHIEMSGRSVSLILRYAAEADGRLALIGYGLAHAGPYRNPYYPRTSAMKPR